MLNILEFIKIKLNISYFCVDFLTVHAFEYNYYNIICTFTTNT